MRVMILGSGGREHALALRLKASAQVSELICAPGNGGTAAIARNLPVNVEDVAAVVKLAQEEAVDFVVVGPEAPLVAGVVDALEQAGILAYGPRRVGAQLEGSKSFSKEFMKRYGVPTAEFAVFEDAAEARRFVEQSGQAWVVKADGLAAGKGVIVADDVAETLAAIDSMLRDRQFGAAGARVVLEQRLRGQEVSYHVVLDGKRYVPLAAAQDHKRLGDGDKGPNTGGMGAYSPPPVVTPEVEQRILRDVVEPTVRGLTAEGLDFRGTLFIGLMIEDGKPSVLEYNTRFGDPETEVLMARYGGDVLPLLLGAARGDLSHLTPRWEAPVALCVVLAAPGYPGTIEKGLPITGTEEASQVPGVHVAHAGTALKDGQLVTSGGRVLCVTATGSEIDEVATRAYRAVSALHFSGMQYRRDIGHHARSSHISGGAGRASQAPRRAITTSVSDTELALWVRALREGGVVACATETFFGLLADALDSGAVDRVCALKGREKGVPVAVLLPNIQALSSVSDEVSPRAWQLAQQHWPGPLTLLVRARAGLSPALVKDGTIGVRVPGPSPALQLVEAFGSPLTATSANRSGKPPARTAQEVSAAFPGGLAAIVGTSAPGGLASTIVDTTGPELVVVRKGPIEV